MTAIARVPLSLPLPLTVEQIQALIPQRFPMLMLDRVTLVEPDVVACGYKNLSINEPFFAGHFPQRPIMPGVLILEALAQATGVLAFKSEGERPDHRSMYYLVGVDNARFKRPVEPGDRLILEVRLDRIKRGIGKFACDAKVEGQLVASAELMCAKRDIEP